MKPITMFYLDSCGYCARAQNALEDLIQNNAEYAKVDIIRIEESQQPDLAEQYDYYAVPSFFDGKKKLFEAHLFMSDKEIREEVQNVLNYALVD